jgi:NAD+ kinase
MERILLFVNPHKDKASMIALAVADELHNHHIKSDFFSFKDSPPAEVKEKYDAAFSLGGDGTALYAARMAAPHGIPIFPMNIGTVGFLASIQPEEWKRVFERLLNGDVSYSERIMLEVTVERKGRVLERCSCLNDAVVSGSGMAKIVKLCVKALEKWEKTGKNEEIPLGAYRSDGLIAATPTGSTAYSVAAGGPILDPEMDAVIINPICPFTLSNRPLVLASFEAVVIEVEAEQRSGVVLTMDGQVTVDLQPEDRVIIRRTPYRAKLITAGHSRGKEGFFRALRAKLAWGGI